MVYMVQVLQDFGINGGVNMITNEFIGNRGGIPIGNATQSSAGSSTTDAAYTMPNHTFRFVGLRGLIVVNFSAAVTTATGINITVNDSSLALTSNNDEAVTALTAGIHILLFDKPSNKLQLIV